MARNDTKANRKQGRSQNRRAEQSELTTGVSSSPKGRNPKADSPAGYSTTEMKPSFSKKQVLKKDRDFSNVGKKECGGNDPSWYIYNDQIFKDGDTAMYINRVGLNAHGSMLNGTQQTFTIPSLMTFRFAPTPGPTHDGNGAPVNQQTLALHRRIQRLLSKNISQEFTPGDLAQFIICMDSVIMAYSWAQRVYLINSYYNAENPTVPRTFWRALRLPSDGLETSEINWEGYRTKLNIIGDRLKNISIPTGFKIIARHTWLVSNIFKDSDTDKASLYMFTPSRYYEYVNNTVGHPGGALAVFKPWPDFRRENTQGHTGLQAILDFLSGLIDRFMGDIDIQTMQGRLRSAFTPEQFMTVGYIGASDAIAPVFVAEVLPQIHNMDIVGTLEPVGPNTGDVIQTAADGVGQVLTRKGWSNGAYNGYYGKVLDMPFDNPSAEHNYVATRLMVTAQSTTINNTPVTRFVHYGSEIVETAQIYWGMANDSEDVIVRFGMESDSGMDSWVAQPGHLITMAHHLHFNMAPLIKLTNDKAASATSAVTQSDTASWCELLGDITNVATLSADNLGGYHVAALMGEWLNPNLFV